MPPMDALTEILSSLRLSSAVWSRGRFTAPWSVRTSGARAAVFHAVVEGRAVGLLQVGEGTVRAERGDLVLFARGDGHVLCDAPATPSIRLSSLPDVGSGGIKEVRCGGGGEPTTVLCGAFAFAHEAGSSFLGLLPPIIHVRGRDGGLVDWFANTIELMDRESAFGAAGSSVVAARLADVLFVQVLRAALDALPTERAGWLAALRDPQIARALAAIHGNPRGDWRVETLAEHASMSRSVFAERFTRLVGESPARYLARWRVQTAADLLRRRPELQNADVARLVGYDSDDAFGRAFKRYLGRSPSDFRSSTADA